jgi:DNA-binding beta-propeller fold protein YncE
LLLLWVPLVLAVAAGGQVLAQEPDSLPAGLIGVTSHRLEPVMALGGYGDGAGEMAFPQGVAVDGLGRIFVADTGNNRVLRFDPEGSYLGEFGGLGFELGRFDGPQDLFVGEALQLWVLDGENLRVVRYDLRGNLVGLVFDMASEEVRARLGLVRPGGLAADTGGLLYVTDASGDRLIVYQTLNGEISELGGFGTQPGRLRFPTGVAVDDRGTIAVADGGNSRIQALDAFGGFVRAWPLSGKHEMGRVSVVWLPERRLAVAESDSSRISVVAFDGRLLARLEERGSGPGQLAKPGALTVDRSGRIYVADTDNHRVQVFELVERNDETAP